jgi:hypothetical protein
VPWREPFFTTDTHTIPEVTGERVIPQTLFMATGKAEGTHKIIGIQIRLRVLSIHTIAVQPKLNNT